MKYCLIILILTAICNSLFAQNQEIQVGFGLHHINYNENAYFNDSITFKGNAIANPGLCLTMRYQQQISYRLDVQVGLVLMKSLYGYGAGYFVPEVNTYMLRSGYTSNLNVIFPFDLKLNLSKNFYIKAGLPLSINFETKRRANYSINEWDDKPYLYEIFDQQKDSYKRIIFNYGIGGGVNIWRLNLELYLQNSLSSISKEVVFGNDAAGLYNGIETVLVTASYRLKAQKD
ncbi:hypothetical protein PZB74_15255 [Porifericola rhodea]|uniref:hypothetical protein n=1 Tax=Porifericola rhodea TaxID=930972 RepID=UPI0026664315|nr:hypothetical protein [Porifericola rhodea]WKN30321.1 hypothetical protein PZB74_15255 [Porifericola rhodea]